MNFYHRYQQQTVYFIKHQGRQAGMAGKTALLLYYKGSTESLGNYSKTKVADNPTNKDYC
jgi:hypothetical protein